MNPHILKSGKFKGKALEAVMFSLNGYRMVQAILHKFGESPAANDWVSRVRALMAAAEDLNIGAVCPWCDRLVTHIGAVIRDEGVTFLAFGCKECCEKNYDGFAKVVPLRFSSVDEYFRVDIDRKWFMSELRIACGLGGRGRIDPQKACDVFFPPTKLPESSPGALPVILPPSKPTQLTLF